MTLEDTVTKLKRDLIRAFAALDAWFDKDVAFHNYKPPEYPWCVSEIMEHVNMVTNYITSLIDSKGFGAGAVNNAEVEGYNLFSFTLDDSEIQNLFETIKDCEGEPQRLRPVEILRSELRDKLDRCLCHLELLAHGQGIYFDIVPLPGNSDKLDLYQSIYIIEQYVKKHHQQLNEIEQVYLIQG